MVLATNIAETSLTIEDVVYVVDTGKLKARLAHVAVLNCISVHTGLSTICHVHNGVCGVGVGSVRDRHREAQGAVGACCSACIR